MMALPSFFAFMVMGDATVPVMVTWRLWYMMRLYCCPIEFFYAYRDQIGVRRQLLLLMCCCYQATIAALWQKKNPPRWAGFGRRRDGEQTR